MRLESELTVCPGTHELFTPLSKNEKVGISLESGLQTSGSLKSKTSGRLKIPFLLNRKPLDPGSDVLHFLIEAREGNAHMFHGIDEGISIGH